MILAAVVAVVAGALGPAVSSASTTTRTQIVGMTLSVGDSSLVGAQLTPLTVRVHLTDPVGVMPDTGAIYDNLYRCPCVELLSFDGTGRMSTVSSQALGDRMVPLTLASGTALDGVWVGRTMLGAVDAGYWRPVAIHAGDLVAPPRDPGEIPAGYDFVDVPDAIKAATVVHVRGDDWPVLSLRIPTTITPVGQPFVVSGYAVTSRTHRALPGLRVVAIVDACDAHLHGVGTATRTSATGRWALTSTDYRRIWCLLWAPDARGFPVNYVAASRVHVRATVTVHAAATSVHVGTSIAVTGRVRPATGLRVVLQRYYSRAWRTVGVTYATPGTGGYRLLATPPRGYWKYRVRVFGTTDLFGTTSGTFTLRGV